MWIFILALTENPEYHSDFNSFPTTCISYLCVASWDTSFGLPDNMAGVETAATDSQKAGLISQLVGKKNFWIAKLEKLKIKWHIK